MIATIDSARPGTSAHLMLSRYRPDIDKLRAIAVLAVIAFHLGIPHAKGGFVGVDIFFVISGFLITGMLLSDIEAGRFSLLSFYERRIRRILPALYVVLAAVALAGWFLLLPPDYRDANKSMAAVVAFGSNVLFWQEAGYFDKPTIAKPLLHTWSLAVEEQFYLFYPLVFWWAAKRSNITIPLRKSVQCAAIVLAAASFAWSIYSVWASRNAAFFLPFSRAFEFLAGALLVTLNPPVPLSRARRRMAIAAIFCLIAVPVLDFGEKVPFPGPTALVPCAGAALYIWLNGQSTGKSEENRAGLLLLFFGRISYSLYLWHWPIIVFTRQWLQTDGDLSPMVQAVIFGASTAMAWLSYRYIEQPIRQRRFLIRRMVLVGTAMVLSMSALGFSALSEIEHGFGARLDPQIARLADYASYPFDEAYRFGTCFLRIEQPVGEFKTGACLSDQTQRPRLLVWGDSIAAHYIAGLNRANSGKGIVVEQATEAVCPPLLGDARIFYSNCKPMNDLVLGLLQSSPPDAVLLSANWFAYAKALKYPQFKARLADMISTLQARHIPIVLLGPSVQYRDALPTILARLALRGEALDASRFLQQDIFDLDATMRRDFGDSAGLTYVSILDAACPNRTCPSFAGSVPMEWDRIHLTVEGSTYVIKRILPEIEAGMPAAMAAALR